jgi:UDP-N-acetylglucosamine acyltransferase
MPPPDPPLIHPSATVDPQAELAPGVAIGPSCVVGPDVRIGPNTRLESHVSLIGRTTVGADNRFAPFVSIGTEPQDLGYKDDPTEVRIGDGNVFKEFVTVNRGTVKGGGVTRIGDRNFLMAYTHIAHDCQVGNEVVFTNAATLAGHVVVQDYAMLSAFTGVHQFCRIGRFAFTGGFTVVTQDVPPFCKVAGMRPVHVFGLNSVGLRRRGFSADRVRDLKAMFKLLFFSGLNTAQALERIEAAFPPGEDRDELLGFVRSSKRGIIKKASGTWDSESE